MFLNSMHHGFAALCAAFVLVACGGGGGSSSNTASAPTPAASPPPVEAPAPETPVPAPPPEALTHSNATRFLSQATFGPSPQDVQDVLDAGLEDWFSEQLAQQPTLMLDEVISRFPESGVFYDERGQTPRNLSQLPTILFWRNSITAPDQLRQRMAFALSQILVVSDRSDLDRLPQTIAHYNDILVTNAFGNYRQLLEEVTYSPAMAIYLTYLRNSKANPATGQVPDENYARELLQLFTLGLIELQANGVPNTDELGEPVEIFDNTDITGLAKVFTGLSFAGAEYQARLQNLPLNSFYSPLQTFDNFHSEQEKSFLGSTITAGTGAESSIDQALDIIFAHPNVGPFIGRQLIQRFTSSSPDVEYVERVAAAFDVGTYLLPSGARIGSGERGDLGATIAAVLFDVDARDIQRSDQGSSGKIREPILRFTHWARAFEVNSAVAANELLLQDTSDTTALGQHPYRAPSVFNFYRPGYIAPGTLTGEAGLNAPEFQITNAPSVIGYPNFLTPYVFGQAPQFDGGGDRAFIADYSDAEAVADSPEDLIALLNERLTHGTLTEASANRIHSIVSDIDGSTTDGRRLRARLASLLVLTTPDYIVLR